MTIFRPDYVRVFKTGLFSNKAWELLMTTIRCYSVADCTDPTTDSLCGIHRDSRTAEILLYYEEGQEFVFNNIASMLKYLAVFGYNPTLNMPSYLHNIEKLKAYIWKLTNRKLCKRIKPSSIFTYIDLKYLFETDKLKLNNAYFPNTVPVNITDNYDHALASDVLEIEYNGFAKTTYDRNEILYLADLLKNMKSAEETNNEVINRLIGYRMNPFEETEYNEVKKIIASFFECLNKTVSYKISSYKILTAADNAVNAVQKRFDENGFSQVPLEWFDYLKKFRKLLYKTTK